MQATETLPDESLLRVQGHVCLQMGKTADPFSRGFSPAWTAAVEFFIVRLNATLGCTAARNGCRRCQRSPLNVINSRGLR